MHTYLGIFRVDPLGIIVVVPEWTLAVRCWMTFSAVGAACWLMAWLVCSSGQDGRFGFEVSLAKSARMTMGFRLVRAGAVAAAQLGCFAPSDCVAPAPASLTEGSTSIGSCSAYMAQSQTARPAHCCRPALPSPGMLLQLQRTSPSNGPQVSVLAPLL